MKKTGGLVYSTDKSLNAKIQQERSTRDKPETASPSPSNASITLHRETKGRGGKTVSIIKGMPVTETELQDWCKRLKQHCGAGGAVKDGHIEIQGEHREKLKAYLERHGYRVKISGG